MEAGGVVDVVTDRAPSVCGAWKAGPVTQEVAFQGEGRIFTDLLLPHIERACAHSGGRFTPRGCVDRWLAGQWTMWAVNDPENNCVAVGFVQINPYPDTGLRTLEVVLLGGSNIRAWAHLEPILLEHAKENNCARVEAWSRSGLSRMLPAWRRSFVIERNVE